MIAPTISNRWDYVLSIVLLAAWSILTPANAFVALAFALDGNWLSLVNAFLTLWGVFNIVAFARNIRAWRKERAQ